MILRKAYEMVFDLDEAFDIYGLEHHEEAY
jgi:hypothetical protein